MFLDDQEHYVGKFLAYNTEEFVQTWPLPVETRQALKQKLDSCSSTTLTKYVSTPGAGSPSVTVGV